jgi:hypothetical protein
MITRTDIEINILRALNAAGGVPLPESGLVRVVQKLSAPEAPSIADVLDALKFVESKKYADAATVDLEERSWTLTTAGIHKARKLA